MKEGRPSTFVLACAALLVLVQLGIAQATPINTTLNFTLDTTSLKGLGSFELAFLLTDGSGLVDLNTRVGISDVDFGIGGSGGAVTNDSTGGFSGDLAAGVSLTDSAFFNLFGAQFSPGNQLNFRVTIQSTDVDSPTPDLFQFAILDSSGLSVPTTDTSGLDTLLAISLDSSSPRIEQFSLVSAVPQPSSLFLLANSLIGAVVVIRRCRPYTTGRPRLRIPARRAPQARPHPGTAAS